MLGSAKETFKIEETFKITNGIGKIRNRWRKGGNQLENFTGFTGFNSTCFDIEILIRRHLVTLE